MVTFILCNIYATLTLCMTLNCTLRYNNYVKARSKRDKGNDLYFQVTGDVSDFELVFPSREVVRVDWPVNVG